MRGRSAGSDFAASGDARRGADPPVGGRVTLRAVGTCAAAGGRTSFAGDTGVATGVRGGSCGREILPGIGSFLAGRTEAGIFLLAGSAAESLAGGVGAASVLVVSSGWGIFPVFSGAEESGLEVGAGRLPAEGVSATLA